MKEQIIDYITTELLAQDNISISADEDLLSGGVLDSLSIVKLISFIENTFNVKVDPQDMVIENFLNVDSMESLILEKINK